MVSVGTVLLALFFRFFFVLCYAVHIHLYAFLDTSRSELCIESEMLNFLL